MELQVEHQTSAVTVFPDRAQVTSLGRVELTADVDSLLFDGLPLSMESESVRVGGAGEGQVQILGVDVSSQHYESSPSARISELQAKVDEQREELSRIEDEAAVWRAEADVLNGLRESTTEFAKGISRGRMSVANQNELLQYIRNQDREIKRELRALDKQHNLQQRRVDKLERELADLRSAGARRRFQVRVAVNVVEPGLFIPELTYGVYKAQWHPQYDLHYDVQNADQEVTITTHAVVSQQTGQDWSEVTLTLSTARPALNQRVPELDPWYIDIYQPPAIRPLPAGARVKHSLMAADSAELPAAEPEALQQRAEIVTAGRSDNEAVISYQVPGSYNVLSNGSPHKFVLSKVTVPIALRYLAIPKHTDAVYRLIEVVNGSGAPVLAGPANLFVGGDFIGRSKLDYTPAEGELELLLGVEERIEVKRELAQRSVDKTLLKDHRVITYGYEIEIENLLTEVVDLELRDHLPNARHEEIKVKLETIQPPATRHSDLNILEWDLELVPASVATVRYRYSVRYPRSEQVIGLFD